MGMADTAPAVTASTNNENQQLSTVVDFPETSSPSPSSSTTSELNPSPNAPPVKKSWASIAKPKDDGRENPNGHIRISEKASNVVPYVVTSDEMKQRTESQKFQRLGEIMFSRHVLDRNLDHRMLFLTPRGMINRGNTCYMNAVLQTLVFCPPFYHLMEALYIPPLSPDQPPELPAVVNCFVKLVLSFRKMPSGPRRGHLRAEDAPLDPSFVYETLEEHAASTSTSHPLLSRGTQEDAQESLNYILTVIHEEMVKGTESLSEIRDTTHSGHQADEWTSISKGHKKSTVRDSGNFVESPLSHIFGGKLRSVRKLKGAKEAGTTENFFMLVLPIQNPRVSSVYDAIKHFMGIETIQGFQDQGREVNVSRQYRFEELPAVLILHLKYFEFTPTGGMAKLQKNMAFDSIVKLSPYWFADGYYDQSKSSYLLYAVIFHWGEGLHGGHYTACIFHPASPTGWIEANDSQISVVGFDYIRQPQYHRVPYLLFYRLQVSK